MPINHELPVLDGHSIRLARALSGLTQRKLAEAAVIKPWTLWKLEAGQKVPRPHEIAAILKVLSTGQPK